MTRDVEHGPAPDRARALMRGAVALAGASGFIAIGLGAWSAHGAERVLGAAATGWLRTGVEYQAWHTLALLGTAVLMSVRPGRFLAAAAIAFALGILLFSGSLYGLALTGFRGFAFVTPFGGVAFLAGWLLLAIYALSLDRES